ncbi:MAG: phosphate acyltransferase PlsX [Alphaproteobacteria bacterium]|nr:phosphate acyltransferase PlsX [Alphaproteobacteria bacterium]
MSGQAVIALDGMGAERGPTVVLRGAEIALERHPGLRFIVFGNAQRLEPLLSKSVKLKGVVELRHTELAVSPEDKPSHVLRRGQRTSMRLAIDAVAAGEAAGVVSAGNTGALMVLSKFVFKTVPGIDRPAIAGFFPTLRGESVLLDLGANVECSANNLVQFAIMGAAFARTVLGMPRPTVGLVNVGEEELKGNETVRAAAQMLRNAALPLEFHGFIEGNDIPKGTTDVIVTDGFAGNIALKTAEGTAKLYSQFLREAFRRSIFSRLGLILASGALRTLKERVDPRLYNGGVLLGLNGITVKSHGGTDATGFGTAIGLAADMALGDIAGRIADDFRQFGGLLNPSGPRAAAMLS